MGTHLKKSEKTQVGVCKLEYFLFSMGEEAISIMSLAKNARNEWVHCMFPVVETSQGTEVANAARLDEEARKNRVRHTELQRTIEFLSVKQNKLLAHMERQQTLRLLKKSKRVFSRT